MKHAVLSSLVALLLALCSGAFGCSTTVTPPIAVVGPDQSDVVVGTAVSLDGSQSRDPQMLALYFHWSFAQLPPGSKAVLSGEDTAQPSFVADETGSYQVALVVSNGVQTSAPAVSTVTAGACGTHAPAVGSIAPTPPSPAVGQHVALAATVTDDDIDKCKIAGLALTYAWTLSKVPLGSTSKIDLASTPNAFFTPDLDGIYTVTLVVTDSRGRASAPASADVKVGACGANPPVVAIVTATPSAPNALDTVQVSATVTDADQSAPCSAQESFSFAWSIAAAPAGSKVALNLPNAANPSFVPDVPGDYVLQVVATDSHGQSSAPKTITVTAAKCGTNPPVVAAITPSPSGTLALGQFALLTPTITDVDTVEPCKLAETFAYAWQIVGQPAGSTAKLNNPIAVAPSLAPDVPGDYTATLVVTDSAGQKSALASVTVTASACGSGQPVAVVQANPASPNTGQLVQVTATVTDSDTAAPCNQAETFTYAWSLASVPAGSKTTLSSASQQAPSLTPDMPGNYLVSLVVTDSSGTKSTPATLTVTAGVCGSAAPVAKLQELVPDASAAGAKITGKTVTTGTVVQVDASPSTDADNVAPCSLGETLSYAWSFAALPPGSATTLNNASIIDPSFTLDAVGTYVLSLLVTDSGGKVSGTATFTITADPAVALGVPAGFTASTVAAGGLLRSPRGLTEDGNGNIYVAQGGSDALVKIVGSTPSVFTSGGMIAGCSHDASYTSAGNFLFLSVCNNTIITVSMTGVQTSCVGGGGGVAWRALEVYSGTGAARLIAADRGNRRVAFVDPDSNSGTFCTVLTTNDFNGGGGGTFASPWGGAGRVVSGVDDVFATDEGTNEVWRNAGGAYSTNVGTDTRITAGGAITQPRDVVTTPCATSKLLVADRGSGNIVLLRNVGGSAQSIAVSGLAAPVGLYVESSSAFLIGDEGGNAVYRISGNLCSL